MGSISIALIRSGIDRNADKKSRNFADFTTPTTVIKQKRRWSSLSPMAAAAPVKTGGFSPPKFYQEVWIHVFFPHILISYIDLLH